MHRQPPGRSACQIIPILPATAEPAVPPQPMQQSGDPALLQRVVAALESAVHSQMPGIGPTARWLREVHLAPGEAHVAIAADLGHDSLESAEIAFDTLRRVLPDTDIYVSAAAR